MDQLKEHWFWKYAFVETAIFGKGAVSLETILLRTRVFYAFCFYWLFVELIRLKSLAAKDPLDFQWPVGWVSYFDFGASTYFVFGGLCVSALFAILFTEYRFTRFLFALFILFYVSITNSFGKINHSSHLILYLAWGFVFIPGIGGRGEFKAWKANIAFVGSLLIFLLTYSMSGFWKLAHGAYQWLVGEISIFSLNSLSNHIARRVIETDFHPLLGDWFIHNPFYGSTLMLSAVYLELASILILFRSSLHRFWGASLVLMHIGIYVGMGISFAEVTIPVATLLILSPYDSGQIRIRDVLYDLPLFGSIIANFSEYFANKEKVLFYDGTCGMCDYFVSYLIKHQVKEVRFATLQGEHFRKSTSNTESYLAIDTVVIKSGDRLFIRSKAICQAMLSATGKAKFLGVLLALIPSEIADMGYWMVAKIRKKVIPQSCVLPDQETRKLFLD